MATKPQIMKHYSKDKVQQALSELATYFENASENQNKNISATFIAQKIRDTANDIERSQNSLFNKIKPFEDFDKKLSVLLDGLGMDSKSILK